MPPATRGRTLWQNSEKKCLIWPQFLQIPLEIQQNTGRTRTTQSFARTCESRITSLKIICYTYNDTKASGRFLLFLYSLSALPIPNDGRTGYFPSALKTTSTSFGSFTQTSVVPIRFLLNIGPYLSNEFLSSAIIGLNSEVLTKFSVSPKIGNPFGPGNSSNERTTSGISACIPLSLGKR